MLPEFSKYLFHSAALMKTPDMMITSCPRGQQSLTWDPTCKQSRACNSKVNSAMWPSPTCWIFYMCPIICKFHEDWIKIHMLHFEQSRKWVFFGTQGQVAPKWIVWSEILCLSRLSASFIKFQLKLNRLYCGQVNRVFFCTKGQITPKSIVRSGRN